MRDLRRRRDDRLVDDKIIRGFSTKRVQFVFVSQPHQIIDQMFDYRPIIVRLLLQR